MVDLTKFKKRPVVISATQWFKVGDHPVVQSERSHIAVGEGDGVCKQCLHIFDEHGWCPTLEGGHIVCPGDWIVTGVRNENYPVKDSIFRETYVREDGSPV